METKWKMNTEINITGWITAACAALQHQFVYGSDRRVFHYEEVATGGVVSLCSYKEDGGYSVPALKQFWLVLSKGKLCYFNGKPQATASSRLKKQGETASLA